MVALSSLSVEIRRVRYLLCISSMQGRERYGQVSCSQSTEAVRSLVGAEPVVSGAGLASPLDASAACGAGALSVRGCGVASSWTATNAPSKTPTLAAPEATTTG